MNIIHPYVLIFLTADFLTKDKKGGGGGKEERERVVKEKLLFVIDFQDMSFSFSVSVCPFTLNKRFSLIHQCADPSKTPLTCCPSGTTEKQCIHAHVMLL